MPKSKNRKLKKITKQIDSSGKLANSRTKKHLRDIRRKTMYRGIMFQEASNSLSLKEWEDILTQAEERRDSTKTIKGPKPILSYVHSSLDENGVPIEAETKHITISNVDINRLKTILEQKQKEEKQKETK